MYPLGERRFLVTNRITIISLFVLILVGGIARSTGSGLGCSDWPMCFDKLVPPTGDTGVSVRDYEQLVEKRNRIAKSLDVLNFSKLASLIRNDKSVLISEPFNAVKAWIDYINRLAGLFAGLLLLSCTIFSVAYLKSRKRIFFLSMANLFLAGFQAWLGAIMVLTNVIGGILTVYMLLTILILGISIYTFFQARILRERSLLSNEHAGGIRILTLIAVALTVLQIGLGASVRAQIDAVSRSMDHLNRSEWIQKMGIEFYLHRDLALIVFVFNFVLLVLIRKKYMGSTYHFKYMTYVALLIAAQIVTGFTLSNLALPPVAQTVHLLLASLIFGAQYYLLLLLKQNKLYKSRIVR